MPAKLILPDQIIDVEFVPVLVYGPPGIGKTQLAQTAEKPVTLDFDKGAHRLRLGRGAVVQFDTWGDVIAAGNDGMFKPYQTLVIDTGGQALNTMIPAILAEKSSYGFGGSLSPQGYGVLGNRFNTWMKTVRSWGKDVVMLCHQDEANDQAGNLTLRPEFPGKMAYKEVHKSFDCIACIRHEGKARVLDFSPAEGRVGKNAPGFDPITIPDLAENPTFLAELIAQAKTKIGQTSAQAAELAKVCEEWVGILANLTTLAEFNAAVPALAQVRKDHKRRVWNLITATATDRDWQWDEQHKQFVEL